MPASAWSSAVAASAAPAAGASFHAGNLCLHAAGTPNACPHTKQPRSSSPSSCRMRRAASCGSGSCCCTPLPAAASLPPWPVPPRAMLRPCSHPDASSSAAASAGGPGCSTLLPAMPTAAASCRAASMLDAKRACMPLNLAASDAAAAGGVEGRARPCLAALLSMHGAHLSASGVGCSPCACACRRPRAQH